MEARVSLKYFANDCPWKHSLASNSLQTPSKLISLRLLVARRLFTQLKLKIRVTNLQETANTCLTW